MTTPRYIAVIDIGKTNAKLALVDLAFVREVAVLTRPNVVISHGPWPHYDVEGHWAFLLSGLRQFHKEHRVDAISITTHGAAIALLSREGSLAAPILDYEHEYPADVVAEYADLKPDFAATGSPTLAGGLNIGAQLHWQFAQDPALRDRTRHIVTYPQYWGHRLTGVVATDVTSIGCHSDLWRPHHGAFSTLPQRLGIADKIAPVRKPTEILGTILPQIADRTGLPIETKVSVGIHDSNASLFAHLLTQRGAFSVVSTGTWVISMAIGGAPVDLDPARDTLINVNANGAPVPSARFMGGREYEMIQQAHAAPATPDDIDAVLAQDLMLLPAVEAHSGPFRGQKMCWSPVEPDLATPIRTAAVSFYLAMMTATCLELTGAAGPTIVEGPFAKNVAFLNMLAAATGRAILTSEAATGTSIGAALLMGGGTDLPPAVSVAPPANLARLQRYGALWRQRAGA